MSTESTSNETSNTSSANKRTRINHDSATTVVPTGILKKPSDIKLPIVAAEGEVDDYVKTLHPELQKFAKSLLIAALGHYGPMFWKKIKHNDNKSNPSFAPVSVEKSVKVQLQALSEVEESEEFKALSASLEGDVADFKKMITDKYVIKTEGMNLDALRNRFISSVCKLLTAMARGFLAEHGVENYSEHQTFIDFFAMSGNDLLCVLKTNAVTILEQYKKVNSLVVVPEPTVAHNLQWLLNKVNGPPPSTNTAPAAPAASTAPAVSVTAQSRSDMSRASALARATVAGLGNHPFDWRPSPYDPNRGSYVPRSPRSARNNATPNNSYVTGGRMIFPSGGANSTTGATNNNTNQGNVNNVSQSTNTHQATNAAVAAAQVGGNNGNNNGDVAMTGNTINLATTPTITLEVVPPSRQVIIREMKDLVVNGLGKSVRAFDNAQELSSTSKRIKQSTKPTQLNSKAERIAAVVAADTPQTTPVIRGLIQEETSKSTARLERELQSTQARLANAEKKLSSKEGSNNNKSKNKNGGGSKKVATNKQKQNHSHPAKGNGTKPAAKNNNNNNKKKSTGKKSDGKRSNSSKKRHN